MTDLKPQDWGRIYSYMWLQDRVGNPYYKNLAERDPVLAIEEIVEALNQAYPAPNLRINYKRGDAIWNIEKPTGLWPELKEEETLKKYRAGGDDNTLATLRMRFIC